MLSKDVLLPNLGLLVIDEEHRFGVKHKEQIRILKTGVDVLTLTATPIPRTLQQSMVGIKKISTILTPPKTRRPIITAVQYFNWEFVYKKIKDETSRGGQVYFLHNNIQTIPIFVDKIRKKFSSVSVVGEVLNATTHIFDDDLTVDDYILLSGGTTGGADLSKIFVILPNGQALPLKRKLFQQDISSQILPGSTIVVSRNPDPYDWLKLTSVITPVLSDLAVSAAAIAAISDNNNN